MNPGDKDKLGGESSRNIEESPSAINNIQANDPSSILREQIKYEENIELQQPPESDTPINTLPINQTESEDYLDQYDEDTDNFNACGVTISESTFLHSPDDSCEETEEMKRTAAKVLIERYFYQVLDGCGTKNCSNKSCASSGSLEKCSPNEAAARALQLFAQDAKLCEALAYKTPRSTEILPPAEDTTAMIVIGCPSGSRPMQTSSITNHPSNSDSRRNYLVDSQPHRNRMDLPTCSNSSSSSPRSSGRNTRETGYQGNPSHEEYSNSSEPTSPSSVSSCPSEFSSAGTANPFDQTNIKEPAISSSTSHDVENKTLHPNGFLDEEKIDILIEECQNAKSYTTLIRRLGEVFSSQDLLAKSFRVKGTLESDDDDILEIPTELRSLKKEDLRMLEKDLDKDEDSTDIRNEYFDDMKSDHTDHLNSETNLDLPSLRRTMEKLFTLEFPVYEALNNAIHSLSIVMGVDIRLELDKKTIDNAVHIFVMVFEIMTMALSEFLDTALPNVCRAASHLPTWAQAKLARIWAAHCKLSIRSLLETLQQLISIQAITCSIFRTHVEDSDVITSATQMLKILYYANLLAGKLDTPNSSQSDDSTASGTTNAGDGVLDTIPEDDDFYIYSHVSRSHGKKTFEDDLEKELEMSILDCRIPYIPFEEFYNEPLSDTIEMDNDYLYYKNHTMELRTGEDPKFTFMLYAFILTPATKVVALYYDSRIRMYSERRLSIFNQSNYYGGENSGAGPYPYLKLKVRREHIIDDALVELEMKAMETPKDFKKQLVVEFMGEQGIDEGGVSKEFFQLVIEEIFNPDFGMFLHREDTETVWFNSTSFENEAQFTLIGIVLGLAIYNNIILAVNFPMVVYRKLMGARGTFYDLADWNPLLYKGLTSILEYQDNDMEDMFMQTFEISYTDVFGNIVRHELKPNGGEIFVNQQNKREFIELYSDYLLNVSIERQFKAFKKGFEMVTDESPLKLLFRPEEIELLVCGSRKFDFLELEKSTEYEGGFTEKSTTIVDFWNIVHGLEMPSKRKLLEFTTGSDRVPVGGLSRLKLVIARNGRDSDRLPTSHTCFNVLLLPEYASKEKLEDRLLKAINYSKGFGML